MWVSWVTGKVYLDPMKPSFIGFPIMVSLYNIGLETVGYLGFMV